MAKQNAIQDNNQFPALIAHSGTAATAETIRVVADSSGAIMTNIVGGEIVASLGTVNVVESGSVVVTAGTISPATGFEGGTVAVGTAPVELTFSGTPKSVMITADFANGTIVYIGGSAVAQSGSAALTYLQPDQSTTFDLDDSSAALYAVGGTTGQKVYKAALI